ncbi:fungal hydrophobin [Paecilomyces variotii]|nr:fungal hydrophobin [Paecilomyces variotii]KAJ9378338.1 fungal hydrophobin [Paecilomyces variotii]
MKFSLTAAVLALATAVVALPQDATNSGNNIRFPVKKDVTVQQAQTKCGDQATLSCCNKATYSGDTTNADSGILGGALSGLISGGSGAGLGLFDQCSKLPLDINVIGVGLNELVNQQCKQNIACCQNSPSDATGVVGVGLPCVALGSII